MIQTLRLIVGSVTLLLAACATTPLTPFPSTHPASPEAQEAPITPFRNSLASDEATKKSTDLLAAAEKGTLTPPPAQSSDMADMPGMNMGNKPSPTPKDAKSMPGMNMGGKNENQ